ncbi:MAG: hypothetical protein CMJ86_09770 [Planctomycetes bacterium]|nr:hypothetical protein [Planctomycetota bacterium]
MTCPQASLLWTLALLIPPTAAQESPSFRDQIQPILSKNCFTCHGPDQATRKAGLRLDTEEGALAALKEGGHALVPGNLEDSQLWQRISSSDPDVRMPPADSKQQLSSEEINLLRTWITDGAKWQDHWAWVAPIKADLPEVQDTNWTRNPIDHFILARLEQEGLAPAKEADRAALLRRLSLDLTGMPPSLEELQNFLDDEDPGAYERVVDRLLSSSRYGEHLARTWLDAARYGDTHGLHLDNLRSMWPWRDWVIGAYNENMSFDRFATEQLAGDLLPEATQAQKVASGFNRCNPTSAEGGMIAEEYLSIYAKDRTDTTAVVMLGVSMGCAQCHDHKYDPFSMKDYYSMLGFFNSISDTASDQNIPNPAPFIRVGNEEQTKELARLEALELSLGEQLNAPMPETDAQQAKWEQGWNDELATRWLILSPTAASAQNGAVLQIEDDQAILASGPNPATDVYLVESICREDQITGLRLEALTHETQVGDLPGRAKNGNYVLTDLSLEIAECGVNDPDWREVELINPNAQFSQVNYPIAHVLDADPKTGWASLGRTGPRDASFNAKQPFGFEGGTRLRVRLAFESQFPQHAIGHLRLAISEDPDLLAPVSGTWFVSSRQTLSAAITEPDAPHPFSKELDLAALDEEGRPIWTERPELLDGKPHGLPSGLGSFYLARTLSLPSTRRLRFGLGSDDGVRVFLDNTRVFARHVMRGHAVDQDFLELEVEAGEHQLLLEINNHGGASGFAWRQVEQSPSELSPATALTLASPASERRPEEQAELRELFRRKHAPEWIALRDKRDAARADGEKLRTALPTSLVSVELAKARPARILMRGAYDRPGDTVQPNTPTSLPPLPTGAPQNRLGLAQWLVADNNPLAARVVVNRHWQRIFGIGIVKTSEDFGTQGERPVHPELLDWLAVELREHDWNLQHLQRLIVTSATYRQSSKSGREKLAQDPNNRLISRGARFRLDGEILRDQALMVSGLLVEEIGGPPVKPYQPKGLWKAVGYSRSNTVNFTQDKGEANYRRSLYTFWKRTSAPPNLTIFDAPSRESTCVRRERTNTPMQALALLNDPQYVEFSREFANRILAQGGDDDLERLHFAFKCLTSRLPNQSESTLLLQLLVEAREHFLTDAEGAAALLAVGATPLANSDQAPEIAAWTVLASTLFSLDEVITRG